MKHDACQHAATPKDRAACRKQREKAVDARIDAAVSVPRADDEMSAEELSRLQGMHDARDAVVAKHKAIGPAIEQRKARTRRRDSGPQFIDSLTGFQQVVMRVPMAELLPAFERCLRLGWSIVFDRADRVIVKASLGDITIVWNAEDPNQHEFWFRPSDSSQQRTVPNMGVAMSRGGDK